MTGPTPEYYKAHYWMKFLDIWFTIEDDPDALPVFKPDTPKEVLESYELCKRLAEEKN